MDESARADFDRSEVAISSSLSQAGLCRITKVQRTSGIVCEDLSESNQTAAGAHRFQLIRSGSAGVLGLLEGLKTLGLEHSRWQPHALPQRLSARRSAVVSSVSSIEEEYIAVPEAVVARAIALVPDLRGATLLLEVVVAPRVENRRDAPFAARVSNELPLVSRFPSRSGLSPFDQVTHAQDEFRTE